MSSGRNASGSMHVRAHVALAGQQRCPGMQTNADGYGTGLELVDNRLRGSECPGRGRERKEKA